MAKSNLVITNDLKELSAIGIMRCMLMSWAKARGLTFAQALLDFARSETYEALFDLETEIWKEGPWYLQSFYEEELARRNA